MKVVKPMLGPCLLFLMESIQMSFVGLKIVKRAKEAWDILQVIHQGTFAVNISKLLMLATKVENIRMHENHNFSSFYSELIDIVNCSFNLREPIPNSKIVRKILRSFTREI